jgi:hypothetical protein
MQAAQRLYLGSLGLLLAVGIIASPVGAAKPCSRKCRPAITIQCAGLTGKAKGECRKRVRAGCHADVCTAVAPERAHTTMLPTTPATCPSVCVNPSVGNAGTCAVLQLGGGKVDVTGGSGGIDGDLCVGPNGSLSITGNQFVTGNVRLASGAFLKKTGPGSVGAVLQNQDLTAAITDALTAGVDAATLPCTQTLAALTSSQVIVGAGGLNVLCVGDVILNGGRVVTLSGGPGDTFVVNVTDRFALTGGSRIVASGVTPSAILYNVIGDGPAVALNGRANVDGTILAPERDIAVTPSLITGEVIGGQEISITGNASVRCPSCPVTTTTAPPPTTTTSTLATTTTAPPTTTTGTIQTTTSTSTSTTSSTTSTTPSTTSTSSTTTAPPPTTTTEPPPTTSTTTTTTQVTTTTTTNQPTTTTASTATTTSTTATTTTTTPTTATSTTTTTIPCAQGFVGNWSGSFAGGHNGTWSASTVQQGDGVTGTATIVVNDLGTCSNSPGTVCLVSAQCAGGTCVMPFTFQTPVSATNNCMDVTFGSVSAASFSGTVTGDTAGGTWSALDGTSGTWTGNRS